MSQEFNKRFIDKFIGDIESAVGRATSKTMMHLYGDIVQATPVDKGPLRASWISSEGQPSDEIPSFPNATADSPVKAPALKLEAELDINTSHHLTNNQPYAERIEEGSSKQAPAGIITPLEPRMKGLFEGYLAQEVP